MGKIPFYTFDVTGMLKNHTVRGVGHRDPHQSPADPSMLKGQDGGNIGGIKSNIAREDEHSRC